MASSITVAVETGETDTGDTDVKAGSVTETPPNEVSLSVPASATQSEAAAITATVGAHLHDCSVARTNTDDTNSCSHWKRSSRLGTRRVPLEAVHGDEWKAAGRSY
jgi:acetyl-CoA/propionyl-CoA carboxylase, PccX subunit